MNAFVPFDACILFDAFVSIAFIPFIPESFVPIAAIPIALLHSFVPYTASDPIAFVPIAFVPIAFVPIAFVPHAPFSSFVPIFGPVLVLLLVLCIYLSRFCYIVSRCSLNLFIPLGSLGNEPSKKMSRPSWFVLANNLFLSAQRSSVFVINQFDEA